MKKLHINRQVKKRDVKKSIHSRYALLSVLVIGVFVILTLSLFSVQIRNNSKYINNLKKYNEKIVEGPSAPRGRIYDRQGRILVDNIPVKTVYYKKINGTTKKEEMKLAYEMADILEVNFDKLALINLKEFWILQYPDKANNLITDEERKLLKERKLTSKDIEKLKLERITDEHLSIYNDLDKEVAYIYYLMQKGYSYEEKIIKNVAVSEEEYAYVSENVSSLKGFNTKLDWERYYPYGDTFKTILGRVSTESSGIPKELKDYYLDKGYALNDRVGLSYLEYQYEDVLRGKKATYRILPDNSYELISEGKRGNDIVISIDIELQREVENILIEEIIGAKHEPNTGYYNKSYAMIIEPSTGEILAMSGKQVILQNGEYKIIDYITGILTSPVTPGSIVKGASMTVGYNTGAIKIGEVMLDECIKIKDTPKKCSWTDTIGSVDDKQALVMSSNSYQFKIAMRVGGAKYQYDRPLYVNPAAFDTYRNTFSEFGFGVKTGIDLPYESSGYIGTSTQSGLLLNYAIGQYDNYTILQIGQYISTIANNGKRMKYNLLKSIHEVSSDNTLGEAIKVIEPTVLNTVTTDEVFMNRIRESFRAVMLGPLGSPYMSARYNPAGKTGTAESFLDTDGDGYIDTETISSNFVGYAPYDNPRMAVVAASPDVAVPDVTYNSAVNRRIATRITNKFFEFYP